MPYPRLLNLSDDVSERLRSLLREVIERHKMERGSWDQDLLDEQRAYWAKPSSETKTFPFHGASNLIVPLCAIAVEAIHAREMTSLFALNPFINVTGKSIITLPESQVPVSDVETPLEEFMHHQLLHVMKAKKVLGDALLTKTKFGTCVGKSGYERVVRTGVRVGPSGKEEKFTTVLKDGAFIANVPLQNFVMPFASQDEQSSPFCGELHTCSPYEMKIMVESGMFYKDTWKKLETYVAQTSQTSEGTQADLREDNEKQENRVPVWPERLIWYELEIGFNIDNDEDASEKEICLHYSYDADLLLAVRYNDYDDLHRSYRKGIYFPVEGRWPGIGAIKQGIEFQREITVQHRQRIDNATLANIRMIVIHRLSGYGPGEPVFPGKMWFVDDMTHVRSEQMGEVYQSAFANEQASLIYGQQRFGVNELTLGMPQAGTPGTATGDIARIQEGSKRFEFLFDNSREFVSQLALDALVNIAQYGSKTKEYFDIVEDGHLVREFLSLPIGLIRQGLLIEIGATTQNSNRALDRQNWQSIAQVLQSYYQGLMALSMNNPQLVALISQKGILALNEVAKQLLETFNMRNIDRILVKKEIEGLLRGQSGTSNLLGAGGNTGTEGNGNTPGIPSIQEVISQFATLGSKPT